eukprot:scaffold75227_cov55-Prasinocladus_malaysianus.AAC.2
MKFRRQSEHQFEVDVAHLMIVREINEHKGDDEGHVYAGEDDIYLGGARQVGPKLGPVLHTQALDPFNC